MEITVYFAPNDDLEQKVIEQIERAVVSIRIQAYKFASERIKSALLEAKNRKGAALTITILLDRLEMRRSERAKSSSLIALQARLLCELAVSQCARVHCIIGVDKSHNKVMIVDENIVLTGSFNYKSPVKQVARKKVQSKRQIDNLVVIEHAETAQNYIRMFDSYFENNSRPL